MRSAASSTSSPSDRRTRARPRRSNLSGGLVRRLPRSTESPAGAARAAASRGTAGYRTYDGFDLSETNPQTIGQPKSKWRNADVKGDLRLTDAVARRASRRLLHARDRDYFFSGRHAAGHRPSTTRSATSTRYSWSPRLDFQVSSRTSLSADLHTREVRARRDARLRRRRPRRAPGPVAGVDRRAPSVGQPALVGLGTRRTRCRPATSAARSSCAARRSRSPIPSATSTSSGSSRRSRSPSRLKVTAGARYDDYSDFGSEWSPRSECRLVARGPTARCTPASGTASGRRTSASCTSTRRRPSSATRT